MTCPYELVCTRSAFSKLGFAASAFFPPPLPPDIKPISLRSKPAQKFTRLKFLLPPSQATRLDLAAEFQLLRTDRYCKVFALAAQQFAIAQSVAQQDAVRNIRVDYDRPFH